MVYQIGYYVHHHGSGHLMRALAIAVQLHQPVTFLGSGLKPYAQLIPPTVNCIHLPPDVEEDEDRYYQEGNAVDTFHYAPLNIRGIRERNRMLCDFFSSAFPMILIVDVSVEVALFARLCGIPTIVMRQHGHRSDAAHLAAYQSAALLIAPYSRHLQSGSPAWMDDKTVFSGGFSKYSQANQLVPDTGTRQVAVMCGKGGTSLTQAFVVHLATSCSNYHFHSIGDVQKTNDCDLPNITFHGELADPLPVLNACNIIIGNGGNNTVMEAASLNKTFICIPEQRPFDEQLHKAEMIAAVHRVHVVQPAGLYHTNWQQLLQDAEENPTNWDGMINKHALPNIAYAVQKLAAELFNNAG